MNYEVKSAVIGGSFEYQYHRNRGLNKLTDDRDVAHIFVARRSLALFALLGQLSFMKQFGEKL